MESHQSSAAALLGRLPCEPARCPRQCHAHARSHGAAAPWRCNPRAPRPVPESHYGECCVPESHYGECCVWVPGVAGASAARDSRQPCAAASGCRCHHWKIAPGERCGNGGVRAKTLRKTPRSDLSGDPCRGRPCAASPTTASAGREPSIRRLSRMVHKARTTRLQNPWIIKR